MACRHCHVSAKPGQEEKTLSVSDFEKIIKNLPEIGGTISFTGGEVLTVKENLYGYLEHLASVNQDREEKNRLRANIQSNGIWAVNDETTRQVLGELSERGVTYIHVAAYDFYHLACFQQMFPLAQDSVLARAQRIKKIGEEMEPKISVDITGGPPDSGIRPVGRAAKLSGLRDCYSADIERCKHSIENNRFTLNYNGDVSVCCYRMFPFGNLIVESWEDIVKRAREDERMKSLGERGIVGLAECDGFEIEKAEKLRKRYGACGACYRIYDEDSQLRLS
jgi:hypothetical protein